MNRPTKKFRMRCSTALVLGVLILSPGVVHATAILGLGGQIFATGGNVIVDVLPSSSSSFANGIQFFFAFPDLSSMFMIGLDNHTVSVDLGAAGFSFTPGNELIFGITSPQGIFVTGPASRNPDNMIHANVANAGPGPGFVEAFIVKFEDMLGGGDLDFNDAIIRVSQASVPEPSTLALLGIGLVGLGWMGRRRQKI